ncbi:MAG TPA: sn-glycerol-3-phosphate ABC transporter ATP-binding protein UgpC [Devosia sp.]|nr:sn-glycerol-3-phosphate ABC transporter ATP-binding protein UgpC [Devosia sp.]
MANISINNVSKSYGTGFSVLQDVSLEIEDGEFLVLVGPSGCGKSTLLRMVAGLESISDGDIRLGARVINDLQPKDRDIAMIFQTYALFPHMTVARNLGFGLKLRGTSADETERRIQAAAKTLGLTPLMDRYPAQLSGGQRQRVAIGRALVRQPSAFLMDEPLANLDTKLRVHMRTEFARLRDQIKTTTIYVTHDQTEAMTLGHRVCVMRDGQIQQVDTPDMLFAKPRNIFVAGFIGSPEMNFARAVVRAGSVHIGPISIPISAGKQLATYDGREVIVGIRPTDFAVDTTNPAFSIISVKVELVERLGSEIMVVFPVQSPKVRADQFGSAESADTDELGVRSANESPFTARLDGNVKLGVGETVQLAVRTDALHFFDAETGLAIG